MKIANQYQVKNVSFKRGLTRDAVQAVKNMSETDCMALVKKIENDHGIKTQLFNIPEMLFCVEKTIQIMKRAGFKLPGNVKTEALKSGALAHYNDSTDTVVINNMYDRFFNLEMLDKAETEGKYHHPRSGHFLQTYLHEFMHAAHFKNLVAVLGKEQGRNVYWGKLSEYHPTEVLIDPVNKFIKSISPILNVTGLVDKILPPKYGYYAKTDLCEYFSEKMSSVLSEQLGDNFSINSVKKDFAKDLKSHPSDWNISTAYAEKVKGRTKFEKIASINFNGFIYYTSRDLTKVLEEHIKYLDGDIFNGNVSNIKKGILVK